MILSDYANTKAKNRFKTLECDFRKRHGDKYDYSQIVYKSSKIQVPFICPEHGVFKLSTQKHLLGFGCRPCREIEQFGHISISENNLNNYNFFLLEYLKEINPYLSNFSFNKTWNFICSKHGYMKNKHIKCTGCAEDNRLYKQSQLFKEHLKYRPEELVKLNVAADSVVLKCEHNTIKYTKTQIQNNVKLCNFCNLGTNKPDANSYTQRKICSKHGEYFVPPYSYQSGMWCPKCGKGKSVAEIEIAGLIKNSLLNDRNLIHPKEIDILSHNFKFGVEYNGLIWHSIGKHKSSIFNNSDNESKLSSKHLNKTELVEAKGYQLFHIFENEWLEPKTQAIWKSVINSKLNNTNRIFARKCKVKELNSSEANKFIDSNHLQGKCRASIRIGLFHDDQLVSVMTFGKSRYNKNYEYELIRFCSKLNTTVVGGASKLLTYFERTYNPSSIISYANRRWSTGNLYEAIGFEFRHNTKPNYFYFKGSAKLFSRERFQKHKLKHILSDFDIELTESDNMFNNGYRKIYDSGNKVYIKDYEC